MSSLPGPHNVVQHKITSEHTKLLYLISRYTSSDPTITNSKAKWIRKIPLLVLIYEGIIQDVFTYDYAPFSEVVGTRRLYLNISQEGRDDIDDLREMDLINALKVCYLLCFPSSAFPLTHSLFCLISFCNFIIPVSTTPSSLYHILQFHFSPSIIHYHFLFSCTHVLSQLSSSEYQSITAYQINKNGVEHLKKSLTKDYREQVDSFISKNGELFEVVWHDRDHEFILKTPSGYSCIFQLCNKLSIILL